MQRRGRDVTYRHPSANARSSMSRSKLVASILKHTAALTSARDSIQADTSLFHGLGSTS